MRSLLCEDLNRLVLIKKMGEFRCLLACRFSRDWDAGTLTQAFAENTVAKFGVNSGRGTPLTTGMKLEEIDANEPEGNWPFREWYVGCLMWFDEIGMPAGFGQMQIFGPLAKSCVLDKTSKPDPVVVVVV